MNIDISSEITFKTARSGGKGGQNVNKVETMVEGRFNIQESMLFSEAQKEVLVIKLLSIITKEGLVLVKSQEARTQLANKEIVVKKLNNLVAKALIKKKARLATKTPKSVIAKRKENKSKTSDIKESRKKINLKNL